MAYKYYQGLYKPQNPEKYLGNVDNIVYRSRLEFNFFRYLDQHPDIINWASEELVIPYLSPKDGRMHRYFPDVFITKRGKDGKEQRVIIEVKPYSQTKPPKPGKGRGAKKRLLTETMTYAINAAKWEAATAFCEDRGMEFKIITEREIKYR